jgi:hypothetical protein
MTTGRAMTIPFKELSDAKQMTTWRPVVPLRPMRGELGHFDLCLVDTGSPNTYLDWELAPLAEVDLSQAEKVSDAQESSVGGVAIEEAWVADVPLIIPDDRYMIMLGEVRVILVKPWLHPGFSAVLGTNGMKRIELIVNAGAGNGQLTVVQR